MMTNAVVYPYTFIVGTYIKTVLDVYPAIFVISATLVVVIFVLPSL